MFRKRLVLEIAAICMRKLLNFFLTSYDSEKVVTCNYFPTSFG